MRRLALTCDTPQCLAFLLLRKPEEADEFQRAAEEKWDDTAAAIRCPVCIRGTGPLMERGDCEACGGRLATRQNIELCRDCGTPTRDNGPDWEDDGEDQDDGHHGECDTRVYGPEAVCACEALRFRDELAALREGQDHGAVAAPRPSKAPRPVTRDGFGHVVGHGHQDQDQDDDTTEAGR